MLVLSFEGRTELAKYILLKKERVLQGRIPSSARVGLVWTPGKINFQVMAAESSCLWKLNCFAWELTKVCGQACRKLQFSNQKLALTCISLFAGTGFGTAHGQCFLSVQKCGKMYIGSALMVVPALESENISVQLSKSLPDLGQGGEKKK